jgi:mono/diheme cytochrome c family protein
MSIFSRRMAVSVLFVLGASACEDLPADLGPKENANGAEGIDTAPVVRETPEVVVDADVPRALIVVDAGKGTPLEVDAGAPDVDAPALDAGANTQDAGENTSENPVPDASVVQEPDSGTQPVGGFAAAYAVFSTNCMSCHGAGKTLDMSTAELAFAQLVGVEAKYKACAGEGEGNPRPKVRVVPGAPESSLLIEKIEGHPSCGKQMPTAMLMKAEDIATVRAWVSAGAPSP